MMPKRDIILLRSYFCEKYSSFIYVDCGLLNIFVAFIGEGFIILHKHFMTNKRKGGTRANNTL